jgi:hypothetical protein
VNREPGEIIIDFAVTDGSQQPEGAPSHKRVVASAVPRRGLTVLDLARTFAPAHVVCFVPARRSLGIIRFAVAICLAFALALRSAK